MQCLQPSNNRILILLISLLFNHSLPAQKEDLTQVWPAKWIMSQDGPAKEYSVHYFRKSFTMDEIPDSLVIHTSGDNRYQLFVNENLVTWGPLRGDLRHWYYESTDIVSFLKKGKNVIAAVVQNYGAQPPDAQLTVQTGFILAAGDQRFRFLNTSSDWKAIHNKAYTPVMVDKSQLTGYYGGGSKEKVDGRQYIWNWNHVDYDDRNWEEALVVENAYARTCKWASRWKLTPRILEMEQMNKERFESARLQTGIGFPPEWTQQPTPVSISANNTASFVLDQGYLTTAYPVLKISGGEGSTIKLTYAEAPYIGNPREKNKGNRAEIEGKNILGFHDIFIADGGMERTYQPLWWRAYRYIKVEIETQGDPLWINDFYGINTHYPFQQKASISLSDDAGEVDPEIIGQIMDIGTRTILACSHETFMDCPYYEESQFVGDSRVEMLVSYYNFGDPSLGRNAIDQFAWSLNEEGFVSARYPTNSYYYIPNFSLFWIGMLYDYMMLFDDHAFVREYVPNTRSILHYFNELEREDGTLRKPDYHNFVDWSFKAGEPPFSEEGYSALVDLHYLMALQWAADLESYAGDAEQANMYLEKIARLTSSIRQHYWNDPLQLFTDIPGDTSFLSQHTNCMAIITGLVVGGEAKALMRKVLEAENMTKATLYWQFYLFEALHQSGLGDQYLHHLDPWTEVMKLGVTTWPETGPNSRSECHGWGASPNYHLLKIVAGITSDEPGFKNINIAPHLGDAKFLEAEIPHHMGSIYMKLIREADHLKGEITIPENTTGKFIWKGKEQTLKSGMQKVDLCE